MFSFVYSTQTIVCVWLCYKVKRQLAVGTLFTRLASSLVYPITEHINVKMNRYTPKSKVQRIAIGSASFCLIKDFENVIFSMI